MSTLIEDIENLTAKYGFDTETPTMHKLNFRLQLLTEELNETKYAASMADAEEVVDGLIDIVVVALGTLAIYKVDIQEAWDEVHRANMSKERGIKPGREDSGGFDLVKPKGWRGPNHQGNTGRLEAVFGQSSYEGC